MKYPVLLPNIFGYPFTYSSKKKLQIGQYVKVPFGKSQMTGVIWHKFQENIKKKFAIKKVIEEIDVPQLNLKTIKFFEWFSEYNMVPVGMSLKLHLLSNEAVGKFDPKIYRYFLNSTITKSFEFSQEQLESLKKMKSKKFGFRVHLLQGTTGSGKTLVYFNSVMEKVKKGYQALILLPEIGLTFEFEKKFQEFFGFNPAIWHSGISKKNKKIIWRGLVEGKIKVVIGARSSLFLPFKNLGEIIVDEEHDQSFKQDEGVIYNARDMAIARAKFENIPINLVSAVPSVETFQNVKKNKYSYSRLIKRYKNANLPKYEIINLKKHKPSKNSFISPLTKEKVLNHLKSGDQVLFFINRRGYSPHVMCKSCLKVFSCSNCSINLVYHKKKNKLYCHYCGFTSDIDRNCSADKKCEFIFSGPGVEKISEEVNKLFPNYKIQIFSSDTMNKKSSKEVLERIINNKIHILVGTQLISKGFHFPNLNCIVVLDIDLSTAGHDLRASEKNLQLYHQLSGRAGRDGKPAIVYFQTYDLNSQIINNITNEDPFVFLENEIKIRKKFNLPPFERFISFILTSRDLKKLYNQSVDFKNFLIKNTEIKVLGPVEAPIFKINKNYRYRILLRSTKSLNLQKKLTNLLKKFQIQPGVKLTIDVDPISFN
ncbi:MAG: primosomal protein N' [Candidatus Pelagibacter sp. TMED118]|nr:MAG: primosomal protein N' [Candidatus Pelagibacter sp. TMED118]|tara:strand:+ start:354 stop:2309 length:1956 start_codon:yes stop_codon:yes gene_type:complete